MTPEREKVTSMTLDRWLEIARPAIEAFADRAFQERAWFNRGPEVSSPTEVICQLFDFRFDKTSQDPSFELSNEQRAACTRFAEMVHVYARTHKGRLTEREVIDDPDWGKIRIAAADLLKVLPS